MNDFILATDKPIFITGAAGFIGFHLCESLLKEGFAVTGYDNVNDYYDVRLKRQRLQQLAAYSDFRFHEADLCDVASLKNAYSDTQADYVVHLAAQAGVRYSLENPAAYRHSNIDGFFNLLEICRAMPPKHLLYASSGSVYGDRPPGEAFRPVSETDSSDRPISFYGATKKAGEAMAYCYSRLHGIPMTGLRFFTVYGEWGRPDMALFIFTEKILRGAPITLFNEGKMKRDFTYIGDVIDGTRRILAKPPQIEENGEAQIAPHALYNIGAGKPHDLHQFVELLQAELGKTAVIHYEDRQAGDVLDTYADCNALFNAVGYKPDTTLKQGIKRFCDWYKAYYL